MINTITEIQLQSNSPMITIDEIREAIYLDFDTCQEGIRDIAFDAGHTGPLNTLEELVAYCQEDEAALEFVLA